MNITTADSKPAAMNTDYHHRLLPTGAKTISEGGSGTGGDELSVVVYGGWHQTNIKAPRGSFCDSLPHASKGMGFGAKLT
jgi:hypothetical protein